MSLSNKGNVLVMQSGGCTAVLNRSLFGIVQEASERGGFGEMYGAAHGIEGLLSGDLIDLGRLSKRTWSAIARTPGAALGSTRRRMRAEDGAAVVGALSASGIRFLFMIGGNDSAETGHTITEASRTAGYALTVMAVPKTVDNDLVLTDHSPGYGSAARFVALATMGAGRDAEAMGRVSPITIIEVMGRNAGWLAAASALARREERDAPHIICIPEVPVDERRFVDRLKDAYGRFGFAVAVISENARGPDGVLGGLRDPWLVDDFGNPYYDGPARYLAALASRHLGVRARYEKPGTIQRSFPTCISRTDAREAEMVGRASVHFALEGRSDQMVTLVREPGERYSCVTGLAPLAEVAGRTKTMPREYLDPSSDFVTEGFVEYARPLVGGPLPRLGRAR